MQSLLKEKVMVLQIKGLLHNHRRSQLIFGYALQNRTTYLLPIFFCASVDNPFLFFYIFIQYVEYMCFDYQKFGLFTILGFKYAASMGTDDVELAGRL